MTDHQALFAALAKSNFRRRFKLGDQEQRYLHSKGLELILQHARNFIADRLAPAHPANDGQQTPWRGHPVFIAQHATATCCRTCLQKWHRIEPGQALTDQQQEYVVSVIGAWLRQQSLRSINVASIPKQLDWLDFDG